jgi:hypothetical protein
MFKYKVVEVHLHCVKMCNLQCKGGMGGTEEEEGVCAQGFRFFWVMGQSKRPIAKSKKKLSQ